jgi:hypothetical protein
VSLSTWLRLDRAADIRASPDHLEAVQRVRRSLVRRVHGKCSVSPAGSSDVLPMRYQRPGGIVGQSCDASGKKDSARPLPTTGSISGASRLSTTLRNSRVLSVYASALSRCPEV